MAIHFTFIASFVMPRKISYQHQWEELKNSHLGVSITSNVITSNDITSIVITSNDLFIMCSIAEASLIAKSGNLGRSVRALSFSRHRDPDLAPAQQLCSGHDNIFKL